MPAPAFDLILKAQLFARLAEGLAGGVTVITPNRRLAQSLSREFDATQADLFTKKSGLASWETADILPYPAFVVRLYEDALYSGLAGGLPILLSEAQEQSFWEEAIGASGLAETLLSASATAAQCREAWKLAHAWGLAGKLKDAAANEDALAFLDWSARYARACERNRQTDSARLPAIVAPLLGDAALKKPRLLILYGFDIVTRGQKDFVAALAGVGVQVRACGPQPRSGTVARIACTAARDEVMAAAKWARSRLESRSPEPSPRLRGEGSGEGQARIGIVVPDLAQSRAQVQRAFAAVMGNRGQTTFFPGDSDQAMAVPAGKCGLSPVLPFNISLGVALDGFSLVHDALLALRLAGREAGFNEASRLVRSPFIAGAESEIAQRSRLDAALRERAGTTLTLDALLSLLRQERMRCVPLLVERMARLAEFRKTGLAGMKSPADWAKAFSQALAALGFPGERSLDSTEYQTLKKWHEVLTTFAALDRVAGRMKYAEALRRLAVLARDTLFQPEAADVPIQILGVLESAGMEFDHLWVMGLTDAAWPLPARPNPFVPIRLQHEAGVPEADATRSLELDRRITAGWRVCANEVVFSHPLREEDREISPSPLIAELPQTPFESLGVPAYATLRDVIHAARSEERVADHQGPALAPSSEPRSGGTSLFKDQAACPFRAFAAHRLGAKALDAPEPGLSALDRGTLLHEMLRAAWEEIGSRAQLLAIDEAALDALLAKAVAQAIGKLRRRKPEALTGRFAELEAGRLKALAREWLAFEATRDDFSVDAVEEKRVVAFGGVAVNARLDRRDKLASGGMAIIDYKSGTANVADWFGARPAEPQLPLYAIGGVDDADKENVSAVAFACVKTGESEFKGVARESKLLPGVKTIMDQRSASAQAYRSWDDLLAGWRSELEALGRSYAAGDARVDPKKPFTTCEHCGMQALCRVSERVGDALGELGDDA